MFLDVALSQTAYGYDVMAGLAITNSTSERFHDICRKISGFRHEAAKHVFLEKIEISHNVFNFHLNDYEEIDAYVKRLISNDDRIVNSLSQIRQSDVNTYVRNHITVTSRLLYSCFDFFISKKSVELIYNAFICQNCGAVYNDFVSECQYCGMRRIDRIDMI